MNIPIFPAHNATSLSGQTVPDSWNFAGFQFNSPTVPDPWGFGGSGTQTNGALGTVIDDDWGVSAAQVQEPDPVDFSDVSVDNDVTSSIEGEGASEFSDDIAEAETTASTTEAMVPELAAAALISQAGTSVEKAFIGDKVAEQQNINQQTYENAINNGHGIGYNEVAANQLSAATANLSEYQNLTESMMGIAGIAGGLASMAIPADIFSNNVASSAYMAPVAGDSMANAQATNVIDSGSG